MIYIDKNGSRINPLATFEFEGGVHEGVLNNPELMERMGITSVPEPTPPEDYNETTYFRHEIDDAPYVTYQRKPREMIDQYEQSLTNQKARAYLRETDWYGLRQLEQGIPIPVEILAARQVARESVIDPTQQEDGESNA